MDITILVSACLMGCCTRYDGGSKEFPELWQYADIDAIFIPICPEIECGLPVPREAMNLYLQSSKFFMKGVHSGTDFSPLMQDYLAKMKDSNHIIAISGLILKARSPSCGIGDTPIFDAESGEILHTNSGLFAGFIKQHYPDIPLISDEDYQIPEKRDAFWAKVKKTMLISGF